MRDKAQDIDIFAVYPKYHERITGEGLPRLLNVGELADVLGVNVRHIRRLVFERRVPYLKWGRLVRFDPREIDKWLQESCRREAKWLADGTTSRLDLVEELPDPRRHWRAKRSGSSIG